MATCVSWNDVLQIEPKYMKHAHNTNENENSSQTFLWINI